MLLMDKTQKLLEIYPPPGSLLRFHYSNSYLWHLWQNKGAKIPKGDLAAVTTTIRNDTLDLSHRLDVKNKILPHVHTKNESIDIST